MTGEGAVPAVAVEGLSKRFGGVVALDGVTLDLRPGEVHALCGQNGAGKSTLIRILGGAIAPDAGRITMSGEPAMLDGPAASLAAGIRIIYQDFHLVPELNVMQNVFLGQEKTRGALLDDRQMYEETERLLALIGAEDLDPKALVGDLRTGEQQMVEVAKALQGDVRVLIMDEPTASLTEREKERLFTTIENLKQRGLAILFVSHHLHEVFRVADRVSTIRNGALVASERKADVDVGRVTAWMLGDALAAEPEAGRSTRGTELLRVEGLTREGAFSDVSLSVHAGEVVGLVGLIGSGRTELLRAIFGLDPIDAGHVYVEGRRVRFRDPYAAVRAGLAFVPEDRKREGVVPGRPILENFSLSALPQYQRAGWIRRRVEERSITALGRRLKLKAGSLGDPIESLSGGNQQKVVLGRWLASQARIFLMDEPTHGIDVGAKVEIGTLIRAICERGGGVLLISSDLDEVFELMDRAFVIRKGRMVREFDRASMTRDEILGAVLRPQAEVPSAGRGA